MFMNNFGHASRPARAIRRPRPLLKLLSDRASADSNEPPATTCVWPSLASSNASSK
jgi:hypothetical protein